MTLGFPLTLIAILGGAVAVILGLVIFPMAPRKKHLRGRVQAGPDPRTLRFK